MVSLRRLIGILWVVGFLNIPSNTQTDASNGAQINFDDSGDLNLSSGIGLYDGDVVITPPPTINGLIMFLTFDQADIVDQSGNNNNANGTESRGPGYFISQGYSAHYDGTTSTMVAASDSINQAFQDEFSVSFWLFTNTLGSLTTEQGAILEKGDQNGYAFNFMIDVTYRQLIVNTAISNGGMTTLVSNGRLLNQRWTHVAITRSSDIIALYMNGNLDSVSQTSEGAPTASRPFYMGRVPYQDAIGGGCNIDFFLDELKVWNIIISEAWIEAESGISLGAGIDPHSIELGCLNGFFSDALNSCTSGFHLGTTVEVYSFAFSAAKSMGWLSAGQRFWSDVSSESDSNDTGVAIGGRDYLT